MPGLRGVSWNQASQQKLQAHPMAHLPSGKFAANAAWLTLAAIAGNLARVAGCLASAFPPKPAAPPSALT